MRYLVISDIHGNLPALAAVLRDCPPEAYDRLLVLGDLVGYGADPGAVIDRIRALTPHVVVRVNDALYELAQEKLAAIARQTGFDGRLLIMAEPDIAIGDCRIEWADGGMMRDRAAADALIGETVKRFVEGRRAPGHAELRGGDDE